MITYHQSFTTRIFPPGNPRQVLAGARPSGTRAPFPGDPARIVLAVKSALRGTERPAKIILGKSHAR